MTVVADRAPKPLAVEGQRKEIRCGNARCGRKIGEYVNEIAQGRLVIVIMCRKCDQPHVEVIAP